MRLHLKYLLPLHSIFLCHDKKNEWRKMHEIISALFQGNQMIQWLILPGTAYNLTIHANFIPPQLVFFVYFAIQSFRYTFHHMFSVLLPLCPSPSPHPPYKLLDAGAHLQTFFPGCVVFRLLRPFSSSAHLCPVYSVFPVHSLHQQNCVSLSVYYTIY